MSFIATVLPQGLHIPSVYGNQAAVRGKNCMKCMYLPRTIRCPRLATVLGNALNATHLPPGDTSVPMRVPTRCFADAGIQLLCCRVPETQRPLPANGGAREGGR